MLRLSGYHVNLLHASCGHLVMQVSFPVMWYNVYNVVALLVQGDLCHHSRQPQH